MNSLKVMFVVLLAVLLPGSSFALDCQTLQTSQTNSKIRTFMRQNGMIKDGDEVNFPDLGVQVRWELKKLLAEGNNCLAVMSLCSKTGTQKDCDQAIEVVALKSAGGTGYSVKKFETVVSTPASLIAQIGHHPDETETDLSFYYVKLSGVDAISANKSWRTGTPYYGFSGTAVRGQKAAYDPTTNPGRNWQIQNGKFDLRRGMTAEVLDVQAYQLDGLDASGAEGYWQGCQRPNEIVGKCDVAPWGQTFLRGIHPVQ
jgi:hypothetical protein